MVLLRRWRSGTSIKIDVEGGVHILSIPSPPDSLHLLGLRDGIEVCEVLLTSIAGSPLELPIPVHCLHI